MKVYVDGSGLAYDSSIDECYEKLRPIIPLKRGLNKYQKCPRWFWVKGSGDLGLYELCNVLRRALKDGVVPRARSNTVNSLIMELATSFCTCNSADAFDEASRSAALAYQIGFSAPSVVRVYSYGREVVVISKEQHLDDEVVCRVLYCNHPDVKSYQDRQGYVVTEYAKHSVFPSDFNRLSSELIKKTEHSPAQFLPRYRYSTSGYKQLIREMMLKAMKSGRYSESRINGFNSHYDEEVGASDGRMTKGVYLDCHSGNVHIYPREPAIGDCP